MSNEIATIMGVSNDYPLTRPEGINNLHVIFWKKGNIVVPWLEGETARESIIQWALNEIKKEELGEN